jgi:hypothetical protein
MADVVGAPPATTGVTPAVIQLRDGVTLEVEECEDGSGTLLFFQGVEAVVLTGWDDHSEQSGLVSVTVKITPEQ